MHSVRTRGTVSGVVMFTSTIIIAHLLFMSSAWGLARYFPVCVSVGAHAWLHMVSDFCQNDPLYMFYFVTKQVGIFSHVFVAVVCCIIGSPRSMNMVCPDNIGRDSWDRGGQEAVVCPDCNSPQEFGGRNPHEVYTRNW